MTAPDGPRHDPPASAVFERFAAATPAVASPDRPWGFFAGLGGVGALALIVFLSLGHARKAGAQAPSPAPAPATAPTFSAPPPPPAPPAPSPAYMSVAPSAPDPSLGWHAPAMVVDLSQPPTAAAEQSAAPTARSTTAGGSTRDDAKAGADQQFADRMASSQVDTAYATRLRDTALIAPQGTLISAILETAVNSDLPGFVRAVVSRDVHGFDGTTVLIPRGATLIGEYHNGVAAGQSRAFVIWTRVLTPDGISVDLGSPATDPLGRAGLTGETNSHFLQRFGGAILLSVLDAGLEVAANNASHGNTTAIVIGSSQQATSVASIALQKSIDIPVTISVPQGTPLRVFVARDLDFSGVVRRQP